MGGLQPPSTHNPLLDPPLDRRLQIVGCKKDIPCVLASTLIHYRDGEKRQYFDIRVTCIKEISVIYGDNDVESTWLRYSPDMCLPHLCNTAALQLARCNICD